MMKKEKSDLSISSSMNLDQFQKQTQKQRRIPTLRFPGFTHPWEQRKLSEITSLITKGTTPKDKSSDGDINFIKVENIDSSSGEITDCSKISIEEHEGYLKRSQLKENDILFSIAGTLGRTTVVNKGLLPANTNQALAILRVSESDIPYIVTVLKGRAVSDFIRKNPTVGAQPNLSLEQVNNLEIPYPKMDEQVKIGDFFREIDNLITLHQRKLDILKQYKLGVLHRIFDGFDNVRSTLRHYKFNEIFKEYSKRNVENLEQYTIGKNGFKLISERTYNVSNHKVFNPGSLVLGIGIEEFAISENLSGCCSPVYTTYYIDTDKCSLGYLNQFLPFIMARNRNRICRKSTRREFEVTSEINDMDLYLPSMGKQIEISKILRKIDNIIDTYNNQVNQLKRLKNALLQQMFV